MSDGEGTGVTKNLTHFEESMGKKPPLSLAGRTLRWSFADGPTAGHTYEHTFNPDGTVVWHDIEGEKQKKPKAEPETAPKAPTRYASFEVGPGLDLVSYLSEAGYTLTVLVNSNNGQLHGFASSAKEWYPVTGKSEPVG
ncbi:MAG: hypothetical protein ABI647_26550 [Gemmatimonadota bacterium]